jgi:hypothetical protein
MKVNNLLSPHTARCDDILGWLTAQIANKVVGDRSKASGLPQPPHQRRIEATCAIKGGKKW